MIFTWSSVEVSKASWFEVIEVPPIDSLNPGWNPLPLMVSVWTEFEAVMGLGLNVPITGAVVGVVTVRVAELLVCPFGLVTCTGKLCALAPTVTLAVNCVLLTKATADP